MSSDEKALDFCPQHRERFALIIVGVGFKTLKNKWSFAFPVNSHSVLYFNNKNNNNKSEEGFKIEYTF